jgi:hypothetical protein
MVSCWKCRKVLVWAVVCLVNIVQGWRAAEPRLWWSSHSSIRHRLWAPDTIRQSTLIEKTSLWAKTMGSHFVDRQQTREWELEELRTLDTEQPVDDVDIDNYDDDEDDAHGNNDNSYSMPEYMKEFLEDMTTTDIVPEEELPTISVIGRPNTGKR